MERVYSGVMRHRAKKNLKRKTRDDDEERHLSLSYNVSSNRNILNLEKAKAWRCEQIVVRVGGDELSIYYPYEPYPCQVTYM